MVCKRACQSSRPLPRHGNDPGIYDPSTYTLKAAHIFPVWPHRTSLCPRTQTRLAGSRRTARCRQGPQGGDRGCPLRNTGQANPTNGYGEQPSSQFPLNRVCRYQKHGMEWASCSTIATRASYMPFGISFFVVPDRSLSFLCFFVSYLH